MAEKYPTKKEYPNIELLKRDERPKRSSLKKGDSFDKSLLSSCSVNFAPEPTEIIEYVPDETDSNVISSVDESVSKVTDHDDVDEKTEQTREGISKLR